MDVFKQSEVWFVIGSQNLYGPKTLQQVMDNAHQVVNSLNSEAGLPVKLVLKPLVTTPDEITALCREANYDTACIGIMTWLHTFSPAKMWIGGLSILNKPLLQFHTQFNAQIPWETMDMDFMNLNQTAHGGREFGFIGARMRQQHSVITGHWQDKEAHQRIGQWMRVAAAKQESQQLKVARFGDNMREVAVTEGDKVAAQIQFGYSVNAYGIGDLVAVVDAVSKGDIDTLVEEYEATYRFSDAVKLNGDKRENLLDAARIELGMKRFLEQGGFKAFTTNFENLYGLKQLPGLAVQRLMQQGYGFGGEGDWKTAALLRILILAIVCPVCWPVKYPSGSPRRCRYNCVLSSAPTLLDKCANSQLRNKVYPGSAIASATMAPPRTTKLSTPRLTNTLSITVSNSIGVTSKMACSSNEIRIMLRS